MISARRISEATPRLSDDRQPAAPTRPIRDLLTPEQTMWMIRREQSRADRRKAPLTLVSFELPPKAPSARRASLRLARELLKVYRQTDEIGWLDPSTLCVVMPDTSAEGAQAFLDRIQVVTHIRRIGTSAAMYVHGAQPASRSLPGVDRLIDRHDSLHGPRLRLARSLDRLVAEPLPWWKRTIDVAVAGGLLVAASPVLLAAAVAIRLSSPGPIIFCQMRTGLGGEPFKMFKFRTMSVDAEARKAELRKRSEQDGPAFKLEHDPRVFPVGRLLRQTSIDELPQLINVLRGDMTLVGPRPLPIDEADAVDDWQRQRHSVTPGLTCIWQIEGRSRVKFDEWMRMDMRYARRRSPMRDLTLVLRTIPAVLFRRGAK